MLSITGPMVLSLLVFVIIAPIVYHVVFSPGFVML